MMLHRPAIKPGQLRVSFSTDQDDDQSSHHCRHDSVARDLGRICRGSPAGRRRIGRTLGCRGAWTGWRGRGRRRWLCGGACDRTVVGIRPARLIATSPASVEGKRARRASRSHRKSACEKSARNNLAKRNKRRSDERQAACARSQHNAAGSDIRVTERIGTASRGRSCCAAACSNFVRLTVEIRSSRIRANHGTTGARISRERQHDDIIDLDRRGVVACSQCCRGPSQGCDPTGRSPSQIGSRAPPDLSHAGCDHQAIDTAQAPDRAASRPRP